MWTLSLLLMAAAPEPVTASTSGAAPNPRVAELFAGDPMLERWAIDRWDQNRDGWLTLFEAQSAADDLRTIADVDKDGRVSVREFQDARAWVKSRYGIAGR